MINKLTIAGLAAVLLAAGAYSPHAQEARSRNNNITVVTKNQAFPLKGATSLDSCLQAICQDV